MGELELQVNGMTCAHCERAVTAELYAVKGVTDVVVDARSGRVQLSYSARPERSDVAQAIEDAGYELRQWRGNMLDPGPGHLPH